MYQGLESTRLDLYQSIYIFHIANTTQSEKKQQRDRSEMMGQQW